MQTRFLIFMVSAALTAGCAGGGDDTTPSGESVPSQRDAGPSLACDVDGDCSPGERCANGACVIAGDDGCTLDGDCPAGQSCVDDRCTPAGGCQNDGDCPDGGRCERGECRQQDPECRADADCAANESCDGGRCVGEAPECQGDGDCRPGQTCERGECVGTPAGGCGDDADCPPGQLCRGGACIGPSAQCEEDGDCRMGQACDGGMCVELPGCTVDGDCPQGRRCVNGDCVEESPGCQGDADCPDGQRCDAGQCVDAMRGCQDNSDCPGAQTCQGGMCVGPGARCIDDGDCARGERCEDGDCVPPAGGCRDDRDCPAGSACVNGLCANEPPECTVDAECPENERCEAGRCVADAPIMEDPAVCGGAIRGGVGMYEGTTMGDSGAQGGCGQTANSPEVVYALTFDAAGDFCLSTAGSDFDTVLYVRAQCADPGSELACNDDNRDITGGFQSALELAAMAGETYYAYVDGYGLNEAVSGDYVLTVSPGLCEAAPDPDPDPDPDPEPPDPPPACAGIPDVIDPGDSVNGTTVGEDTAGGSCSTPTGPEAIYQLQIPGGGAVCLDTNGSDFDTILYVRTDCGDGATEVGCDDDGGEAVRSQLALMAEGGVTYFIFVDGYLEQSGDYTLTATAGACP
jgi:hypothetical protein